MYNLNRIKLVGGELCFDFVNTVHDRNKTDSDDYLGDNYLSLIRWANHAGVGPKQELTVLLNRANKELATALVAHKKAVHLRNTLFALFVAIAGGNPVSDISLSSFNRFVSEAFRHKKIVKITGGFRWEWDKSASPFDMVLWPIIESAHNVLIYENQRKIKKCPACFWLFTDKSKAGRRIWCSMDTCGAVDKAKRYYQRKKERTNQKSTRKN